MEEERKREEQKLNIKIHREKFEIFFVATQ